MIANGSEAEKGSIATWMGPCGFALVAGLCGMLLQWLKITTFFGIFLQFIYYLAILAGTAVAACTLVLWLAQALLRRPLSLLLAPIVIFSASGLVTCVFLTRYVAGWTFGSAVQHGEPIIVALNAYRSAHGHFPEKLNVLVPGYLKEIPGSGLPYDDEFIYVHDQEPGHDKYTLIALTAVPFDELIYESDGIYESGLHEVGKWRFLED